MTYIGSTAVYYEGFLWENGNKTVLAQRLPKELQGQLRQFRPFSISNQVKAAPKPPLAPDPTADVTIHILATAKDNGVDVTVVCTRDNAGAWTFAEIQLPEGVTVTDYTTINSSGTIAAIGNAGTGNGHALLLLPAQLAVTNDGNNYFPTPLIGWNNAGYHVFSQSFYAEGMLQSPWIRVIAKVASLPGVNIMPKIYQDMCWADSIMYKDGSSATCHPPNYLADPKITPSIIRQDPGVLAVIFNPLNTDGSIAGDAPIFPLSPAARKTATHVSLNTGQVRNFLTVSVNGGPVQIVAEVTWSVSLSATFSKTDVDGKGNNLFISQSDPMMSPGLNETVYGKAPIDTMVTRDGSNVSANHYDSDSANWHAVGGPGTTAVTHPYPIPTE